MEEGKPMEEKPPEENPSEERPMEEVGRVRSFFARPGAAEVEITKGTLKIGDTIRIKGHTTDLEQAVESMQIENKDTQEATAGQNIGLKVIERVRPNDIVYKL